MSHVNEERRAAGLHSLLSHHRSATSRKRFYLGELMMIDGTQLHTANTLFIGHGPEWFRVLEEALAVTQQNRKVLSTWQVASHQGDYMATTDGRATHWRVIQRTDTASNVQQMIPRPQISFVGNSYVMHGRMELLMNHAPMVRGEGWHRALLGKSR